MKSISKNDKLRVAELTASLEEAHSKLVTAHVTMLEAIHSYNEHVATFNEVVGTTVGFGEDIAREIEQYMDERSDKWHESDRADAYEDWKSRWADMGIPEADVIDDPDLPDLDSFIGPLNDLPDTPDT